jgi:hypothetical protein
MTIFPTNWPPPKRLAGLGQGIAAVDHRRNLPRRYERNQIA